jgi:hypothetical protein
MPEFRRALPARQNRLNVLTMPTHGSKQSLRNLMRHRTRRINQPETRTPTTRTQLKTQHDAVLVIPHQTLQKQNRY